MSISKKLKKKLQKITGTEVSANLFSGDFKTTQEVESLVDVPDGSLASVSDTSSLYIYNAETKEWLSLANITNEITEINNFISVEEPVGQETVYTKGNMLLGINTGGDLVEFPQPYFTSGEAVANIPLTVHEDSGDVTWRVRSFSSIPGWRYASVSGGSTSYEVIDVEPETVYTFEDCTHTFDALNSFIFLNEQEQAFAGYYGLATGDIEIPRDCKKVVFSVSNSSRGPGFGFIKKLGQTVETTIRVGVNLADGVYYSGWRPVEDTGVFGFESTSGGVMSGSIPVREGNTYYYYRTKSINGIEPVAVGLDENDNCVALISSEFSSYARPDHYVPIIIPEGLGIVKIMLIICRSTSDNDDFIAGDLKYALVEEPNYRIIENFKDVGRDKTLSEAVNDIISLRDPINKTFLDKNLMIMGDSVYATQTDASLAYYANGVVSPNSQGTNKLYGGANAEIVRRLRPATWTNYSNGGWTMTYTGSYFGQDIYDNGDTGNYLYLLERFFVDYDAYIADPGANDPRYAPDIFMISSCINDFLNPTEAWVTDTEISASGKSYDQYMEDTFISSGVSNDTLIPLNTIDLTKVAGGLRYLIERIYRKFPKCYIVVVTSNKTSNHPRENQMKCTRDMIWIAERLNVQVIDVFNGGNQMNPLLEFKDSATGTRDELYLSQDGIHHYGSVGNGDQRHGRFITNELIKGYFNLSDFL